MALPPIISSLPIVKLFKPHGTTQTAKAEENEPPSTGKDTVQISEAAQAKLKESATLKSEGEARAAAAQTREQLQSYDGALGLDPQFS
jgi:hypothetical protein